MQVGRRGLGMAYSLWMSDFRQMSEVQRADAVSKLVEGAFEAPNGHAAELDEEIKSFERRYELLSEHLLEELSEGRRKETAEIAYWLWLLDLRGENKRSESA